MSMKDDLKKYPIYVYKDGELIRLNQVNWWNRYEFQMHHYIKEQRQKYKDFEKIEHLQKLILLPVQMHTDLHNFVSNFEEKWGIPIKELLYDYEGKTEIK